MELGPQKKLINKIIKSKKSTILENIFSNNNANNTSKKLGKTLENSGKLVLGSGAECVVVDDGNEHVLAIRHNAFMSPIEVKKEFYIHKILTTLFPKNFPKIYASFVKGEDNISSVSGTIREKIYREHDKSNDILKKTFDIISLLYLKIFKPNTYLKSNEKSKEEETKIYENKIQNEKNTHDIFYEIENNLKETGMQIYLDNNIVNFISDKSGNPNYVDMVSGYIINKSKKDKLILFMTSKNYSETDIRIVSSAFDRMIALESEKNNKEVDFAISGKREYEN